MIASVTGGCRHRVNPQLKRRRCNFLRLNQANAEDADGVCACRGQGEGGRK